MEYDIIGANHIVTVGNHRLIHLTDSLEWTVAVFQYDRMVEVVSEMKNNRSPSNLWFIIIDFYYGIPSEAGLLAMKGITKLIAEAPGIADRLCSVESNTLIIKNMGVIIHSILDCKLINYRYS